MADRSWEEVEEGFIAVRWAMEALHGRLESLEKDGMSDRGEFGMAAKKTGDLLRQFQDVINEAGRLRRGDPASPKRKPVAESFYTYVKIVPSEHVTWEEMLEQVAGEIPAGRVLIREAELVAARAVQEMDSDGYAFLHFNPQMDLSLHHQLLVEERAAESFFPFASTGKMELKVVWHGMDALSTQDYQPGEIRLTSADIVAMRRFRHFSDMIYCLEQLPSTIVPSTLNRLGFEVLRTRGPSLAPEGPVDSEGALGRPDS